MSLWSRFGPLIGRSTQLATSTYLVLTLLCLLFRVVQLMMPSRPTGSIALRYVLSRAETYYQTFGSSGAVSSPQANKVVLFEPLTP